jgi:hypothetical protein
MWLLNQLEPGTPTYNIPLAVQLTGWLSVRTLEQSLNEIVSRHEALRTTFAAVDGSPVQIIAPTMDVELPIVDLGRLAQTEREAEARRLALEEKRRPFDLEGGPLFRAKLVRLDQQEHLLLLTIHHIVSDGWSIGVIWRELGALYAAFSTGGPSPLPELPIQYADFAAWQRRWLAGEVLDEQLGYWKRQLADVAALELPTNRPRPPVQTFRGARQGLVLPELLTEALRGLSRREGVTLFITLLAAFQALLARYAGQEDVVWAPPSPTATTRRSRGL